MNKLKRFTSVEELYNRKGEPTGEIIIDEVIEAIRTTKTHKSEDIALLLDVDQRALWFAVQLLTGMRLNDIVLHWRVLQAKEKWDEKLAKYQEYKEYVKAKKKEGLNGFQPTDEYKRAQEYEISIQSLETIAKRYGWDSYKSLKRTASRFGESFKTLRYTPRTKK